MLLGCPRCPSSELTERRVVPSGGGAATLVHLCNSCSGVWLDGHTLVAICPTLAHLPEHRDEIALVGCAGAGIARCLRCGITPYEFQVIGVAIDFCLRCYGVWLDGDEYEEALISGERTLPDEAKGGPYRQSARAILTGLVKCAYCDELVEAKTTYVRERGPACARCHFAQEQRTADRRAAESGSNVSSEPGVLGDLARAIDVLLMGNSRR